MKYLLLLAVITNYSFAFECKYQEPEVMATSERDGTSFYSKPHYNLITRDGRNIESYSSIKSCLNAAIICDPVAIEIKGNENQKEGYTPVIKREIISYELIDVDHNHYASYDTKMTFWGDKWNALKKCKAEKAKILEEIE